MKSIPLLLLALCLVSCQKDKDQAGDWAKEAQESRGKSPGRNRAKAPADPQMEAAYEQGMSSLRQLEGDLKRMKAEEQQASGGRAVTNMANLRQLETSIASLKADLAKMKVKMEGGSDE